MSCLEHPQPLLGWMLYSSHSAEKIQWWYARIPLKDGLTNQKEGLAGALEVETYATASTFGGAAHNMGQI